VLVDPDPSLRVSVLGRYRDVLMIGAISIWGLHAAKGFLIPLALAVLAFVLISALADRARARMGIVQWLANLVAGIVVFGGILGIMYILATQATSFAKTIASYETELDQIVDRFIALLGENAARAVGNALGEIDLNRLTFAVMDSARSFLSTFMLIGLYVGFMVAERRIMVHKMLIAAGDQSTGREMAAAASAISISLQRYVSVKTMVSLLTGLVSYVLFKLIGVEFPETWALITFALNFIPSIGSIIAVVFPAAFALVQFDTLGPFFLILFGCGFVQFLIGNLLDPAMMGRTLNLSTLVVMLALTFWSAVWGIIGAFLSVPLTVCVLIVFSHIPSLRPLAILLSKDGKLGAGALPDAET
jgi:predicted PurR-regulated permease PerM